MRRCCFWVLNILLAVVAAVYFGVRKGWIAALAAVILALDWLYMGAVNSVFDNLSGQLAKHRLSDNVGGVKQLLSVPIRALGESAISLLLKWPYQPPARS